MTSNRKLQKLEREQAIEEAERYAGVTAALSSLYTTIMEVDLATHRYRALKNEDFIKKVYNGEESGDFDGIKELVLKGFMHPDMEDLMRKYLDLDTLADRLDGRNTVLTEYRNKKNQWTEARFIVQKRDASGRAAHVLYVARDVTWEKEKEAQYRKGLEQAALEAKRANLSKTNFLRRMSHDIRTPLNGIVGMLHIAERNKGDQKKQEECLEKIGHSTDYLLSLVNNVLDISKMESGTLELEHKPFDLGKLLLDTLPLVDTTARENGLSFRGGREDSYVIHRFVVGSPVHLNRILMNIASNAVKYNRPGGYLRIFCRELSCDGKQATYEFVCEDNGIGMSEEFQARAFETFAQEGKETTTSFNGSGLGLSIVKDVVEMMGGTVTLSSKENVGTRIRIELSLPLDETNGLSLHKQTEEKPVEVRGEKALLVEDNELNREIARMFLEEIGLVVTEAKNGKEGLDCFEQSTPGTFAYIFMDMMMPVMDGIEATRAIRGLSRSDAATVPIIAMTANAFEEDKKSCLEAGMNDHIGKPIQMDALKQVIRRFHRV